MPQAISQAAPLPRGGGGGDLRQKSCCFAGANRSDSPAGRGSRNRRERPLKKLYAICAVALSLGCPGVGHAGDDGAKNKDYKPIVPPVNFEGGYSVNLDTERPKASDLDAPPALAPLRDDAVHPFVGLKLSKPLQSK